MTAVEALLANLNATKGSKVSLSKAPALKTPAPALPKKQSDRLRAAEHHPGVLRGPQHSTEGFRGGGHSAIQGEGGSQGTRSHQKMFPWGGGGAALRAARKDSDADADADEDKDDQDKGGRGEIGRYDVANVWKLR